MIVKFKPGSMDLDLLCFTYETQSENSKPSEKILMSDAAYYDLRSFLGAQRFYVKDLLTDTLLANFLVSMGADTLSRMTFASPCVDTLSVTRHGDTIPIQDHLYMLLHFKNDTSIVLATYVLNGLFNSLIYYASPDMKANLRARIPNDEFYGRQKAFHSNYTDVEGAWNYEVGDERTRIAIIDDGINYSHCEFDQSEMNDSKKIVWGWNYFSNDHDIRLFGVHGTKVAGIIGGLSNRSTCPTGGSGIAGINGGWGTLNGYQERGIGASIYGYSCGHDINVLGNKYISSAISAIYDASSRPPNSKYGKGFHFINVSMFRKLRRGPWGIITIDPTPGLLQAVNHAYENKVSFATPRGNFEDTHPVEPECYEVNKVFSVGAAQKRNGVFEKTAQSSYGWGMDILAPTGDCNSIPSKLWTPMLLNNTTYNCPGEGTSYASPQVAGIASLLHSYNLNSGLGWNLHPEDYEGILKVAAKDINHDPNGIYKNHYDINSGWGLVNAKNIFTKIVEEGYKLEHHSISPYEADAVVYDQWSHKFKMYFDNSSSDKYIPSGLYEVKRRKVTITVSHPNPTWYSRNSWNSQLGRVVDYKIYVWGNGGNKHDKNTKKGLSYTGDYGYNFQTGYAGVISGYGGNEEAEHNMIHDYETHGSNSHKFSFNIYQYQVNIPGKYIEHIPQDIDLQANYSVFAVPVVPPTSVKDSEQKNSFDLFPTITDHKIHLMNVNFDEISSVYIINALGEKVKEINSLIGVNFIDVANLPIGTYYVVGGTNRQNVQKFIIVR